MGLLPHSRRQNGTTPLLPLSWDRESIELQALGLPMIEMIAAEPVVVEIQPVNTSVPETAVVELEAVEVR